MTQKRFSPTELKSIPLLAEKVAEVANWYGGHLMVIAYDDDDNQVVWIESLAGSIEPDIMFGRPGIVVPDE